MIEQVIDKVLMAMTGRGLNELQNVLYYVLAGYERVVVYGKGAKERETYLTAFACMHLKEYLDSRTDDNAALFVSLRSPHERLTVSGVEEI